MTTGDGVGVDKPTLRVRGASAGEHRLARRQRQARSKTGEE
jgi:hypothetical protein